MTNHDTNIPTQLDNSTNAPVAYTHNRADVGNGAIAARITETRFAAGGRRFGVVFYRDIGDLCLAGEFSMSLGQDELMDLIASASAAYFAIEQIRRERKCSACHPELPFHQLEANGWDPDHDEVFPSQIES